MKRGALIAALLALVAVTVVLVSFQARRAVPVAASASPGAISEDQKARIRDFWSVYRQACAFKLEGNWEKAIQSFHQALDIDPRHEDSLYNLANCYLEVDQFADALRYLEMLVAANPMSLRGHLQIGMIRACPAAQSAFDLRAAEAALRRAFEINQEESGSLLRLGEVALMRGEDERAVELFSLANRSNFRAVEGYYVRAYVSWKEKRPAEARELLEEALKQSKKPTVVAGVPGEGDTRSGASLPPTTLERKLPLRRFWSDLAARHPGDAIDAKVLDAEFSPLKTYLTGLTRISHRYGAPETPRREGTVRNAGQP